MLGYYYSLLISKEGVRCVNKMVLDMDIIDKILEEGKMYYHCIEDGMVYAFKDSTSGDYMTPLFNIIVLSGFEHLPKELSKYNITTGYCVYCKEMKRAFKE